MSAFGGDMTASLRITAKDETQGPIRAASSGFSRFRSLVSKPITVPLRIAGGGLALLRDINLGLRPVLAGLDRMIERGAALETQQRAFGKFTQLGTRDSAGFARSLQQSALWTLRLGEALTIANRAMTTNIPREALDDLFKFAARRAAATGETTAGIIGGLVSGLGIGSARALKQFGLDIEHVADNYERIHGAGAFDELPFAARQAMILKAAMGEMRREVQLLRFSGREAIFSWQAIKTHVGDMTDKLFAAVARSDAMRKALGRVRDILAGITRHFETGGSFGELLFGKAGGKSGGLLGGVGALFKDLGGFVGEGLRAGLGSFRDLIGPITIEGLSELTAKIGSLAGEIRQAMVEGMAQLIAGSRFGKWFFGTPDAPGPGERLFRMGEAAQQLGPVGTARTLWNAINAVNRGAIDGLLGRPRRPGGAEVAWENWVPEPAADALGFVPFKYSRQWGSDFTQDYSSEQPPASSYLKFLSGSYTLSTSGINRAYMQRRLNERRLRSVEGQVGRDARKMTAAKVRQLRREGFAVTPEQREKIEERFREELSEKRGARIRSRLDEIDVMLGEHYGSGEGSMPGRRNRADAPSVKVDGGELKEAANQLASAAKVIERYVNPLMSRLDQLITQLSGGTAEIAKARGSGAR